MKFLADMGISMSTVQWLRSKGHNVLHVRELNMQRSSDADILNLAKKENRTMLTFDLDFGTLLAASGDVIPSVVTFRVEDETPDNINDLLNLVLNESFEALGKGSIISVEQNKFRVRRLPIK